MSMTRRLGLGALALGLAAPFAGSPYRKPRAALDLDAVTRAIADGSDHVSARQLARWIRDRRPGLRVIDVRSARAFADFAIPTAENVPIERLAQAGFAPGGTIVLYSEEGAHAGQAWVILRALGITNAVFVPGGLADWRDEVMSPAVGGMPQGEREEVIELRHYFGGSPRLDANQGAQGAEAPLRRRGC